MSINNFEQAYQILEKYFYLFVEKQKKDGYQIQILLDELRTKNEEDENYFYVRFWKENQQSKFYKIDF